MRVFEAIADGRITPLYHRDILTEYEEVLRRPKFNLPVAKIKVVLDLIVKYGIEVFPQPTGEIPIDMDDLIFYEVALEKRDDNMVSAYGGIDYFFEKRPFYRALSPGYGVYRKNKDHCGTLQPSLENK